MLRTKNKVLRTRS